jgi:hypothetical protein
MRVNTSTDAQKHHEIAESLRTRQRLVEQADQLVARIEQLGIFTLEAEDRTRLQHIREELATLHMRAANAYTLNVQAFHQKRKDHALSA